MCLLISPFYLPTYFHHIRDSAISQSSSYTLFASVAPPQSTDSSVSEPRVPRNSVYTGFAMEKDVICKWAHLLTHQLYDPDDNDNVTDAWIHLMGHVNRQRGYFSLIGEGFEDRQWMVVTRMDRFNGYRGMPESELPTFKEKDTEKVWRERFARDGLHPHEYVFKTVLV